MHRLFRFVRMHQAGPVRFFAKKRDAPKAPAPEIDFDLESLEGEMQKSIVTFEHNLQKLTIGRGDPRVFDELYVPSKKAYLSSLAQVVLKNANEVLVKPFDAKDVDGTIAALHSSDIKANITKDPTGTIHVTIPKPSQEYRTELVRKAKAYAEEAKVQVRKVRQSGLQVVKKIKNIPEDENRRLQKEVQTVHDKQLQEIDKLMLKKEQSIFKS